MAAYEESLTCITLPAGADLSAKQYHFVTVNSSGQAVAVSSDGGAGIGVLQNNPDAAGKSATIAIAGVTKTAASASISAGVRVASDNAGKAGAVGSGDDFVMGVALEAMASGGIYPMLIEKLGVERSLAAAP